MRQREYEKRVKALEDKGMTTSDAQGFVDAEALTDDIMKSHSKLFKTLQMVLNELNQRDDESLAILKVKMVITLERAEKYEQEAD